MRTAPWSSSAVLDEMGIRAEISVSANPADSAVIAAFSNETVDPNDSGVADDLLIATSIVALGASNFTLPATRLIGDVVVNVRCAPTFPSARDIDATGSFIV